MKRIAISRKVSSLCVATCLSWLAKKQQQKLLKITQITKIFSSCRLRVCWIDLDAEGSCQHDYFYTFISYILQTVFPPLHCHSLHFSQSFFSLLIMQMLRYCLSPIPTGAINLTRDKTQSQSQTPKAKVLMDTHTPWPLEATLNSWLQIKLDRTHKNEKTHQQTATWGLPIWAIRIHSLYTKCIRKRIFSRLFFCS